MRVLLVQSYLGGAEPPVYPIGLASVRASLNDHEVRALDTNLSKDPFGELKAVLKEFVPEVIGISLRNIDSTNKRKVVFYYKYLKEIIDVIRPVSSAKIAVGGSGFSMFAKEIMDDEQRIDYGVFLEGENTFPALLNNLGSPEKVKSVYYRENGKVRFTGLGEQVNLNKVNPPDRGLFDLSRYNGVPDSIGIETKRGCMLKCIYCIYGFLNGKDLRMREPGLVVDEIENILKKGGKSFTFVDAVFNIPLSHAEAICREIIKRGIKVSWSAWFHEEALKEDFVKLCKEAGCTKFILSPDGFSDRILETLGKNLRKKHIVKTLDTFGNVPGVEVCYNFFKNPPGQDMAAFLNLVGFFVKTKRRLGNRAHFEFNSIRIEPHTSLYNIALNEGFVKRSDTLLFPKYYTNPKTFYIEKLFNMILRLKGK
ncbi:MAG: cobalamin B12-binding domain-containing protein [Deltaproteobacteria bacterium]|nr:cobalamin B12-binding domain-containing protein [Deltaproteobacteria bacterium]